MENTPVTPPPEHDPTEVNLAEMDKDEKEMEQKMIKAILGMPE